MSRLTLIAVVSLSFVLYALYDMAPISTEAGAQIKVDCADDETREKIRALILTGIDQALINQVAKLFEVWMREAGEPPKRALTGADLATNAYLRARANSLKWNPPLCEEKRP